jgi:hypothetical protein
VKRAFASVGIRRAEIPMATRVRFIDKIRVGGPGECWEWEASRTSQGYGRFMLGQGHGCTTAQRVAYAIFVEDLAPGLTIDHLCNNPGCVRPAHLQAVPHRVNVRRGGNAKRTHCKNGHPLKLYVGPTITQRFCPICARVNKREWMRRLRGSDPRRYRV